MSKRALQPRLFLSLLSTQMCPRVGNALNEIEIYSFHRRNGRRKIG